MNAQEISSLTLEDCYSLASENYPLIKQKDLFKKIKEYSLDNADKGFLPQITFNGQATYQSDVTRVPAEIPGLDIPTLSKDQYKIYADINQPLTAGRGIRQQKRFIEAETEIQEQQLEVDIYQLRERLNQVYFGILLIKEQIVLVGLLKKDIQTGLDKTKAAIAGGIALKSSADMLNAELLKSDQRTIELHANMEAYIRMLGQLINKPVNEKTLFQIPQAQPLPKEISRPELKLFNVQRERLDLQREMIFTHNRPQLGLFLQAGYGKPGINFLKNTFDFYYIGGVRFLWPLAGMYTSANDRQLLLLNQDVVKSREETFLFNTTLTLTKQQSEMDSYAQLIDVDHQLILLYESILKSANAQLESGTITSSEYLTHVNAIDVARQNMVLHQEQLLLAQYNFMTTSGN